jgi:hypothetical protein
MTPEQKAAYIIAQAICALAEIEGMKTTNRMRERRGETIAYSEEEFFSVSEKYNLHHNAVTGLFQD